MIVFFFYQVERSKQTHQFNMRFGTAMDKVPVSRNSNNFSNKQEKEKAYEGQRLPMSPAGMLVWITDHNGTQSQQVGNVISHFQLIVGVHM